MANLNPRAYMKTVILELKLDWTGLVNLGFVVDESLYSLKQVQENVVRLVILWTLSLYVVHLFVSLCTSSCTEWNMLWKDEAMQ